jgi:beta-glucosidase
MRQSPRLNRTLHYCLLFTLALYFAVSTSGSMAQDKHPFQDPSLPIEKRITNLLSLMTLDEKIAVLGKSTAVPRLGVPNAGSTEGIHGLQQRGLPGVGHENSVPTTQFAQVVGMAQTWDVGLIQRAGKVEGVEARYIAQHEDRFGRPTPPLVVWAPNADLARDPRWGRGDESYGEDPFFDGTMAAAFVRGLQGDDPNHLQVASLLKHFLANSNEHGRYYSSSDFDERLFREYYSVPFRMAFEAGASSYMASLNAWNSVPMAMNPVLDSIVAKEWNADGIVSTDAEAISYAVSRHKYFPGTKEAIAASIKIGVNQFLDNYEGPIRDALKANLISESDIDHALRGKFRIVIRLGLLDPPSSAGGADSTTKPEPWNSPTDKEVALEVAREGIVLLKNAKGTLPLDRHSIKSIAVYGDHASKVFEGFYSGEPPYTITPVEGLQNKLGPNVKISVDHGSFGFGDRFAAARDSDVAIVFVGNDPTCNRAFYFAHFDSDDSWCETPSDGVENSDRRSLELPEEDLIKQVYAANPRTIVVLLADFPYTINWTDENIPAILTMSQNAQEIGTAIADVLFGDYNPAGRTVVTWPKSIDQLPPMLDYNIRHGRTYMYFSGKPLYPFGYGLSYTTFSYSNLRLNTAKLKKDSSLTATFDVTNSGMRDGDDVAQLYVSHLNSTAVRPLRELKGFRRIHLAAGQTTSVQFTIPAQSLAWWNPARHEWQVESDTVRFSVGPSSANLPLHQDASVVD